MRSHLKGNWTYWSISTSVWLARLYIRILYCQRRLGMRKHDISSTDMHPFVHPFNPAITPPWEARSDWDIFKGLAQTFSTMAKSISRDTKDIVAVPLMHDSPGEIAQPFGKVSDWHTGEVEPIPGKTMPNMVIVERDYKEIYNKYISLGPLLEKNPVGAHGIAFSVKEQYEELKKINGEIRTPGVAQGRPSIESARQAAEAILTISSATNGKLAMKAWEDAEKKTGVPLKDISAGRAEKNSRFLILRRNRGKSFLRLSLPAPIKITNAIRHLPRTLNA